jgi:hypothetical protein
MKKSKMNAITLRAILGTTVVTLIGLAAVGFYFDQSWLRTFAVSVSKTVADSQARGSDVQSLKKLQADLLARQDIITKVDTMTTSSQDYQNQVIKDLDKYAAYADVQISNYTFVAPVAASTTPATTTTTVAPVAASGSQAVTVAVTSPISYAKLLKFMTAIEGNLPKMQISSINLGRVEGGDSSSVRTEQLTIEVYTK